MTHNLLAINLVTRHTYTLEPLCLDWQKPRRASLLSAVCQDPARNRRAFVVTAFSRSATLTNSTGGPLGVMRVRNQWIIIYQIFA